MKTSITASMLYDFVQCPHRVTMDLFEDFTKRDPINPFVQLLWEKGNAFEQEVIVKGGTLVLKRFMNELSLRLTLVRS